MTDQPPPIPPNVPPNVPPSTLGYARPAGEAGQLLLDNTGRAKWAAILLAVMALFSLLNVPLQLVSWMQTDVAAMPNQMFGPQFSVNTTTTATGTVVVTPPAGMPATQATTLPAAPPPAPPAPPNPFAGQTAGQIALAAVQGTLGCVSLLAMIGMIVAYQMWQYRASENANRGIAETRYSPGMGVGWWFIPIANFFMPLLVLRDLWRAAHAGEEAAGRNPATFAWLCFVGIFVLSIVGGGLSGYAIFSGDQALFNVANVVGLVNTALVVGFYVLIIAYVRGVQKTPAGGAV